MQPQSIINLLALAVVLVGIYHGAMILARKLKERDAKKLAAEQALNLLLLDLVKTLEVVAKSWVVTEVRLAGEADRQAKANDAAIAMQEKILIGTTKACEAIAATTEKHRETVASLGKLLFGNADKDALLQPTELDRDLLAAEMSYRAQGSSPEEAKILAAAEIDREVSMPSV